MIQGKYSQYDISKALKLEPELHSLYCPLCFHTLDKVLVTSRAQVNHRNCIYPPEPYKVCGHPSYSLPSSLLSLLL